MKDRFFKGLRLFVIFPLLSLLPPALGYRLAALAYRYDPALRRPTRLAAAGGLERGFPARLSPAAMQARLDGYQAMLGRELLDVYWLPRLNVRNIRRWARVEGLERLTAPRADGRGRILLMAHFSRPSLLFAAVSLLGAKIHVLTQAIDHRNPNLDALDRAFLRFKVAGNQKHLRGRWVTVTESPRFLYQRLRAGETVVILFDVAAAGDGPTTDLPLFGRQIRVPQGAQRLAAQTGAALLYGAIHDEGWQAAIRIDELPGETPAEAFAAAAAVLEGEILTHPEQWWQWNIFDYLLAPAASGAPADSQKVG